MTVNPAFMPMRAALRLRPLALNPLVAAVGRAVLPLMATSRPRARLRMVEYRGRSSATMVYDALPVNDHFRSLDDSTLLGAMDMRGLEDPYLFLLHREDGADRDA